MAHFCFRNPYVIWVNLNAFLAYSVGQATTPRELASHHQVLQVLHRSTTRPTHGREIEGGIGFEVRKAVGRVAAAASRVTAALRRATGAAVGGFRDFGAAATTKRAT